MPPEAVAEFRQAFGERGRSVAGSKLYRTFVAREVPAILAGRYDGKRLTVPTRVLFGLDDPAIVRGMLDDFDHHADDVVITDVPACNHFIVEERPAQVVQWLRQALALTA